MNVLPAPAIVLTVAGKFLITTRREDGITKRDDAAWGGECVRVSGVQHDIVLHRADDADAVVLQESQCVGDDSGDCDGVAGAVEHPANARRAVRRTGGLPGVRVAGVEPAQPVRARHGDRAGVAVGD
jgi:hypothetical protein